MSGSSVEPPPEHLEKLARMCAAVTAPGSLGEEAEAALRAALLHASDDEAWTRGLAAVGVGPVLRALAPVVAALVTEADLPEWRCPSCGAVTRARMADHP